MELPGGRDFLSPAVLAGELCAVLEAGAAGLIVDLTGAGACDSARLDALMRTARRARGWGSWLRLVIPDPGARKVVRLVALNAVMPVHASLAEAVAAATWKAGSGSGRLGAAGRAAVGLAGHRPMSLAMIVFITSEVPP